jgi:hypothetical protein
MMLSTITHSNCNERYATVTLYVLHPILRLFCWPLRVPRRNPAHCLFGCDAILLENIINVLEELPVLIFRIEWTNYVDDATACFRNVGPSIPDYTASPIKSAEVITFPGLHSGGARFEYHAGRRIFSEFSWFPSVCPGKYR